MPFIPSLRSAQLVGREWFFTHDMRGGECASGGAQLEAPRAELLKQSSPAPSNSVMTDVWQGCLSNDQQGKPGYCQGARNYR